MKVGEFYVHKYNQTVCRVEKIGKTVKLKEIQCGVAESIKLEYFNDNYIPCNDIYAYKTTIEEAFKKGHFEYFGRSIKVSMGKESAFFSIVDDEKLEVYLSDNLRNTLEFNLYPTYFRESDTVKVINLIADLFNTILENQTK